MTSRGGGRLPRGRRRGQSRGRRSCRRPTRRGQRNALDGRRRRPGRLRRRGVRRRVWRGGSGGGEGRPGRCRRVFAGSRRGPWVVRWCRLSSLPVWRRERQAGKPAPQIGTAGWKACTTILDRSGLTSSPRTKAVHQRATTPNSQWRPLGCSWATRIGRGGPNEQRSWGRNGERAAPAA